jgi:mono/diheme cytochrome c family protein
MTKIDRRFASLPLLALCLAGLGGCGEPAGERSGAARPAPAGVPAASRLAEGKRLYLSYGCAACHGPQGKGDGMAAASLAVPPRDLSDPGSFRQGSASGDISRTIAEGLGTGRSAMPASPFIPAAERLAIAEFIRSLKPATAGASGKDS